MNFRAAFVSIKTRLLPHFLSTTTPASLPPPSQSSLAFELERNSAVVTAFGLVTSLTALIDSSTKHDFDKLKMILEYKLKKKNITLYESIVATGIDQKNVREKIQNLLYQDAEMELEYQKMKNELEEERAKLAQEKANFEAYKKSLAGRGI